jgi:hypothetical protein
MTLQLANTVSCLPLISYHRVLWGRSIQAGVGWIPLTNLGGHSEKSHPIWNSFHHQDFFSTLHTILPSTFYTDWQEGDVSYSTTTSQFDIGMNQCNVG